MVSDGAADVEGVSVLAWLAPEKLNDALDGKQSKRGSLARRNGQGWALDVEAAAADVVDGLVRSAARSLTIATKPVANVTLMEKRFGWHRSLMAAAA